MVEDNITYGLFDTKETKWLWEGSYEELLTTLKEDNKDLDLLPNATFQGRRLFIEMGEYDKQSNSFIVVYKSRLLFEEYKSLASAVKPLMFYKIEGQRLSEVDVFQLLDTVGIKRAYSFTSNAYYEGPNFRNGPVENVGKHYKFGTYYRHPNQSGMRNEISRYSEDREFIKHLTKRPNELSYWDENPRCLTRSWKDNKMKHQWQKHIK